MISISMDTLLKLFITFVTLATVVFSFKLYNARMFFRKLQARGLVSVVATRKYIDLWETDPRYSLCHLIIHFGAISHYALVSCVAFPKMLMHSICPIKSLERIQIWDLRSISIPGPFRPQYLQSFHRT